MYAILIVIIILSLIFDFLNGVQDSSNIVATMISTRALSPKKAMLMTAAAEFSGPFIFGVAVAETIGNEIVGSECINIEVLLAALLSAICWNLLAWNLGLPSSSSHALIGGIIGAVVISAGWQAIRIAGLSKVLIALFFSPIIGFVVGFLVLRLITLIVFNSTPRINIVFKRSQIITSLALALSHGTNDAQKTMGVITLALVTANVIPSFEVPLWVKLLCAGMIALGTSVGNWKLIRTLGARFYKIRPMDGFAAQFSSAFIIIVASLFGGPVSTTQVVSSSIMGVGAAERLSKVRWGVAGDILTAWFLTIPVTGLLAAGLYWIITQFISF